MQRRQQTSRARRVLAQAAACLVIVALAACTSESAPEPEPGGDGTPPPATDAGAGQPAPDADVRLALEQQLGHHAMLLIDMMRVRADGGRRVAATDRLLDRNTAQLQTTIADLTAETSDAFVTAWDEHIRAMRDVAAGDDGSSVDAGHPEYAAFVAEALRGTVSEAQATEHIATHTTHAVDQLSAYRDGDHLASYALQREAYAHLVDVGGRLAGGPADGATELRSALGQLLGEHTWLALAAARGSGRARPDAPAAAAALNGNTEDLVAALRSIYDEPTATAFDAPWRAAIGRLVAYTVAVAEADEDAQRTTRRRLARRADAIGAQLSEMTDGTIPVDDAREAVRAHFTGLARSSAAFARGRFRRADATAYNAYEGSAALADLLANGIAAQRPEDFPNG